MFDKFVKEMQRLIIKQYFGKPNAMAEIALYCSMIQPTVDLLSQLSNKTGYPLEILSLLAGMQKSAGMTDKDFLSVLKAIFESRNFSPTITGLQKVYNNIFGNKVMLVDNLDSSFTILIDSSASKPLVQYFTDNSHRLPAPIGITPQLQSRVLTDFFGFEDNVNAMGFGDKRPSTPKGGHFVEKIA